MIVPSAVISLCQISSRNVLLLNKVWAVAKTECLVKYGLDQMMALNFPLPLANLIFFDLDGLDYRKFSRATKSKSL
ncbi:hypothetical protein MnTg02_02060 [bacterium MnTg02]|nr:hypothetical protein MnTg02_02060 [bacterium MnTg02]